jgi:endonuclease/exonuclease/phosphatase family metal-dependent hydrolase
VQNTDVEVPLITTSPFIFDDIRLTDRDVILMRTDLPPGQLRASNPRAANYTARLPLPIGISVLRGWCSIDVQERGRTYRFINTHLEDQLPATLPDLQGLQALELIAVPANTTLPVLLAGDFNSDANGIYSPATYRFLIAAGRFTDAWTASHGTQSGLTWGHDELLADPTHPFSLRLDLALFRGDVFKALDASVVDPVIGALPPLWFSDHAAVFASATIN